MLLTNFRTSTWALCLALGIGLAFGGIATPSEALAADKPNILVIWGDDIGTSNISINTPRQDGLPDA